MALLLVLTCHVFATPAQAEAGQVVVLPMTSTSRSLEIYQRAISVALARALNKDSSRSVVSVASASEVPKNASLIIEGRLVAKKRGRVSLEARVRRVATGLAVATLATKVASTTDLDSLVASLAQEILPVLEKGPPPPVALPQPAPIRPNTPAQAARRPQRPPTLLLMPATGSAADGVVAVRDPATASAAAMLSRMGIPHAVSSGSGEDLRLALTELRRSGSRYLLSLQVLSVDFYYNAVLSARGSVRVSLFGPDGLAVFAKTVHTDTVVGGRGDRHQALVYRVTEQALDMLLPQFRKLATWAALEYAR